MQGELCPDADGARTFAITRAWIMEHRTAAGGWTRAQIEALGMKWSQLRSGWIDRYEGTRITESCRRAFEQGRHLRREFVPKTPGQIARAEARRRNAELDHEMRLRMERDT